MKKTKITCNITSRTKNEIQHYIDENLYKLPRSPAWTKGY